MAEARVERSAGLTAAVVLLALSSGAVDALSFVGFGGVFASVMTGNLVLLGVTIVHERLAAALAAGLSIAAYVAGVFVTSAWLRRTTASRAAARSGPLPRRDRGFHARRPKPGRREEPGQGEDPDARDEPRRRAKAGRDEEPSARDEPNRDEGLGRREAWGPGEEPSARDRPGRGERPGGGVEPGGGGEPGPAGPGSGERVRGAPGWWAEDGSGGGSAPVDDGAGTTAWAWRLRRALLVVPVAQAVVLAGWVLSDGRPGEAVRLSLLIAAAFAMGVQSAGVNTLPLTGAATTYLTGTLTTLTTELATSGVPSTVRRRSALLAAALAGALLDAALLTWARPAAPVLPLAATLTVLLILARTPSPRRDRSRRR